MRSGLHVLGVFAVGTMCSMSFAQVSSKVTRTLITRAITKDVVNLEKTQGLLELEFNELKRATLRGAASISRPLFALA